MDGASHRPEALVQPILHQFSDLVRRAEVIGLNNHVHVNEHLLTKHPSAGDVMAVQNAGNLHRFGMDRFRCDRNVIDKPRQGSFQNRPADANQQQCHGDGQCDIQPAHVKEQRS